MFLTTHSSETHRVKSSVYMTFSVWNFKLHNIELLRITFREYELNSSGWGKGEMAVMNFTSNNKPKNSINS
jgi:hypothetical protein